MENKHIGIESYLQKIADKKKTDFSAYRFSYNFRKFVLAIGPVVDVYNTYREIVSWQKPFVSLFTLTFVYLLRLYSNYIPVILLVALWFWMVYYAVHRPEHLDEESQLSERLHFIQESMNSLAETMNSLKQLKAQVIEWQDPLKAKKFQRLIEISIIPGLVICYYISFPDLLFIGLVVDLTRNCPYVHTGLVLILSRSIGAIDEVSQNISPTYQTQSNQKTYKVYENQRKWLGVWKHFLLPTERNSWSDNKGRPLTREEIQLPENWEWTGDWEPSDWEYALDFGSNFHKESKFFDCVRRRCWNRTAVYKD